MADFDRNRGVKAEPEGLLGSRVDPNGESLGPAGAPFEVSPDADGAGDANARYSAFLLGGHTLLLARWAR
jgi:hypothetical protein